MNSADGWSGDAELFSPTPSGDVEDAELAPLARRVPFAARVVAVITLMAVFATGVAAAIGALGTTRQVHSDEVAVESQRYVDESPWGWLVSQVIVTTIEQSHIAAYVIEKRAAGVVYIDQRAWEAKDLEETIAHEIGHLIDFAAFGDGSEYEGPRRGGLESEVWAECAAVQVAAREVDGQGAKQTYRCTASELETFTSTMHAMDELCRPWDEVVCVAMKDGLPLGGR